MVTLQLLFFRPSTGRVSIMLPTPWFCHHWCLPFSGDIYLQSHCRQSAHGCMACSVLHDLWRHAGSWMQSDNHMIKSASQPRKILWFPDSGRLSKDTVCAFPLLLWLLKDSPSSGVRTIEQKRSSVRFCFALLQWPPRCLTARYLHCMITWWNQCWQKAGDRISLTPFAGWGNHAQTSMASCGYKILKTNFPSF